MTDRSDPVLVYSDVLLDYDFGPQHPLRPERYRLTYQLLDAYGLTRESAVVAPSPASDVDLERVHTQPYIETVKRLSREGAGAAPREGLARGDNPPFPRMHDVSAHVVGGSIEAARRVMTGQSEFAFNMAGGLHHALPGRASGFCIYNDPAGAIAWLLHQGVDKIVYLDTDAHHGDGVQWIFYGDPRVMTISIHESGRYLFPGTGDVDETGSGAGAGTSINVPLEPGASDADMLVALDEAALPLAEAFNPDIFVFQLGCDAHRLDPLTHLQCSLNVFPEIARREQALAQRVADGRAIAGGGGGYAWREVVPRAWASMFGILSGSELSQTMPERWREATGIEAESLTDEEPGVDRPLESTGRTIQSLWRALGRFTG
ncbi:MAG TPA: acetoin utilization protein AcuC [Chloroflexota bacterium]|nr:acetoin utilization protein AcuC [Chloroflexota bacterium]